MSREVHVRFCEGLRLKFPRPTRLHEKTVDYYRFIREHTKEFRVTKMCQVLSVSRSGYYDWLKCPLSKRKMKDMELKKEIGRIYDKNRKRYGSPRIYQQLSREGYHIGKKRVERLMRELGIQAVAKRKYKATTDSAHSKPVAENLLNRDFTPEKPKGISLNTLKSFTIGKDCIPLWGIILRRNMKT